MARLSCACVRACVCGVCVRACVRACVRVCCSHLTNHLIVPFPAVDCADLQKHGERKSGLYYIFPGGGDGIRVYCDFDHEGGGWTVSDVAGTFQ